MDIIHAMYDTRCRAICKWNPPKNSFRWLVDYEIFRQLRATKEFINENLASIDFKFTLFGVPILITRDVDKFELVMLT